MFNQMDNEASCNISKELLRRASACGSNKNGPGSRALWTLHSSSHYERLIRQLRPVIGGYCRLTSCNIPASQYFVIGSIESIKIYNISHKITTPEIIFDAFLMVG